MQNHSMYNKNVDLFKWIVDISTIIALILQCIKLPQKYDGFVPYIAYAVIVMLVIDIIVTIAIHKKKQLARNPLINKTKKLMRNSTGTVVMIGGDLSWTEDYVPDIKNLTQNNQKVEIFFPKCKIIPTNKKSFDERVCQLKNAGATIFASEEDTGIRCTMIDVDSSRDLNEFKIIISKRTTSHKRNLRKNKYRVVFLNNSNDSDKLLCNSFYNNYLLLKRISKEYL